MSKMDEVLKEVVKAGSEGISREDLMKKLGMTTLAVYTHISRLNKAGNHITCDKSRYFCVKTAAAIEKTSEVSPKAEVAQTAPVSAKDAGDVTHSDTTYRYDKVAQLIMEQGDKGLTAHEIAKAMKVKVERVFGYIHTLRVKNYKIKLNVDRYVIVRTPDKKNERGPEVGTPLNRVGMPPIGAESLSEAADKMINSGKVHKKLLSLGTPVGVGGNLTAQQQEYLDMVQKSMFYALCAEALVQSAQHTHNIQKEVSGEE